MTDLIELKNRKSVLTIEHKFMVFRVFWLDNTTNA